MIISLREFVFHSWVHCFISFLGFFLLIYLISSFSLFYLTSVIQSKYKIGKALQREQINSEIKLSLISILIFALQSILIQYGIKQEWFTINWQLNYWLLPLEIIGLFIWNEIHFYASHWLLHRQWFFKHVHLLHHQSHTPSPFSTYSFHWFEAVLLGSVIFIPILIYPFQYLALLSLPIMSIVLNVLGHWDYDLFPDKPSNHWAKFSYRHSMHHQRVFGNYGFFLTFFDSIFKTSLNDKTK